MCDLGEPRGEGAVPPGPVSYTCPGELYSIPRSIHIARLAAFYPKCRDCKHRFDTGHLLANTVEPDLHIERRVTRHSLLTDESVRGVYLNELDRNRAIVWGEALAASLWDRQPMIARCEPDDRAQMIAEEVVETPASVLRGPTVVVGFDERPSSPDIVLGVVQGLRRMGCTVIDLGQSSLPTMAVHLRSLEASAGLFVTGAGCDSSLTGFDFLDRAAMPWTSEELLKLEQSAKTGVGRQSRQIGAFQPLQAQESYLASLESHFHALRPLRIVCGSATRYLTRVLDRLFARLPCQLNHIALPTRRRNLFDPDDVDLRRIATAVVESQQHLGLIIDEDGQHASFVTDRGRLVTSREIGRMLIEFAQRDHHSAKFVVATSWLKDVRRWLEGREATAIDGTELAANLVRRLVESDAVFAISADGRIWFQEDHPACDAILTFAYVLQALSLSDAPFSEIVAKIGSGDRTS